jgi:nitrogen regulatory protein PII 2
MKDVIAVIRPGRWQATKEALTALGITSHTQCRVSGRGRQKGLRYLDKRGMQAVGMVYMPKRLVWLSVSDEQVPSVVDALIAVNKTGEIGDGKIFVCPAENAIRVRTGDEGPLALL